MQIDTRGTELQKLITKLASEFFTFSEKRILEAELGRKLEITKFNLSEYVLLTQMYPYNETRYFLAHTHFYRYALTVDRVINRMNAILQHIRKLDDIGDTALYEQFRKIIIHPNYLPWGLVERDDFYAKSPAEQIQYDIRQWPDRTAISLYLFQFREISDLIALTQGLYMIDVLRLDATTTRWCNFVDDDSKHAEKAVHRVYPKSIDDDVFSVKTIPPIQDCCTAIVSTMQPVPAGGAMLEADDESYESISRLRGVPTYGTFCKRISDTLKRIGGTEILYASFNQILHELNRVLSRTYTKWKLSPSDFLKNLNTGPLLGSNLICPPGSATRLVDKNGFDVPLHEGIVYMNGKPYTSGRVDPTKSGCVSSLRLN
jgi:hypothetical protein